MMKYEQSLRLYLEITSECNFRCSHCHLWKSKENQWSLSTEAKVQVINDFARIPNATDVIFTGGEPTLKSKELLDLCQVARDKNLKTSMNTNGSIVGRALSVNELALHGPDTITFSLDSWDDAIHDSIRGIPGAAKHAKKVISEISRLKGHKRIFVNIVVSKATLPNLVETIEGCKSLGVDGIDIQLLSGTFGLIDSDDLYFKENRLDSEMSSQLSEVLTFYKNDEIVSGKYSRQSNLSGFLQADKNTEPIKCMAFEKNVIVNCWGDISLCFNYSEFFSNSFALPKVTEIAIDEFYKSMLYQTVSKEMQKCQRPCKTLNCNRR